LQCLGAAGVAELREAPGELRIERAVDRRLDTGVATAPPLAGVAPVQLLGEEPDRSEALLEVDLGRAVDIRLGKIGCLQLALLGGPTVPGRGRSPRNPDLSSATRERGERGEEEVPAVDPGPGQVRGS
jgi:hypothetical protein